MTSRKAARQLRVLAECDRYPPGLGKLAAINSAVQGLGWPRHTAATREMLKNILVRMAVIDKEITASAYNGGDDTKDRPPTGDDYNLLWDAILDEINAVVS